MAGDDFVQTLLCLLKQAALHGILGCTLLLVRKETGDFIDFEAVCQAKGLVVGLNRRGIDFGRDNLGCRNSDLNGYLAFIPFNLDRADIGDASLHFTRVSDEE